MISYASNFEDVILQRALSDVSNGCYVDVGASNPVADSNTFAFYQEGWRGICVEPQDIKAEWDQARPRDIFINAALGEKPGELIMHGYKDAGQIATGSTEIVEHWRASGLVPDTRRAVPIRTLDSILLEHLDSQTIHLISIDVEGMEREVLLGLNLKRFRPWVLIVEATVPGTNVPFHHKWEAMILDAGYLMVYFDGANRFYLSNEQRNLLDRFSLPPNVWDNFVRLREIEGQKRCAELEAKIERLTDELNACRRSRPS